VTVTPEQPFRKQPFFDSAPYAFVGRGFIHSLWLSCFQQFRNFVPHLLAHPTESKNSKFRARSA
jgi:hypothetical protein